MAEITPLYGCYGTEALSYLLKVNDTTILLDCGWTPEFDLSLLEPLRAVAADVDVVLISHPDIAHCGALPYAVANFGLDGARIYMTKSCENVAKVTLRDEYRARRARCTNNSDFDDMIRSIVRRADIDECFMRVNGVEFGAPEVINPNEAGGEDEELGESGYEKLVAKAIYAGRLLGGAVWIITSEVEEFVYAVDFASTSTFEHVVPGIDWHQLERPTPRILITDAYHTNFTAASACNPKLPISKVKERRAALQDEIKSALRGGGNVLIPVDTSGRVLELIILLEDLWQAEPELARVYPLFLVGREVTRVLEVASNNVGAMKRRNREREVSSSTTTNAFADLRHFPKSRCVSKIADLFNHPDYSEGQGSKPGMAHYKPGIVVLATDASIEGVSASRALFERWSSNPRHVVLCTTQPSPGSVAHQLLTAEREQKTAALSASYTQYRREVLEGEELEEYRARMAEEAERRKQEAAAAAAAALAAAQEAAARDDALLADSDDEFDEDDLDIYGGSGQGALGDGAGGAIEPEFGRFSHEDAASSLRQRRQRQQFDYKPTVRRVGDYGQPIKLGDFGLTTVYDPTNPEFTMRERMEDELRGEGDEADDDDYDTDDEDVVSLMDEDTRKAKGKWPPTKVVAQQVTVPVACLVLFVDMSGHADNLAHQKLVEIAAPQRMVVVHGGAAETDSFAQVCRARNFCNEIYTPPAGDTTVFPKSKSFKVALSKALMASLPPLKPVGVDGVEVASVSGVLRRHNNHFILDALPEEEEDSGSDEDPADIDGDQTSDGDAAAAQPSVKLEESVLDVASDESPSQPSAGAGAQSNSLHDEPAFKRRRSLYVRDRGTALNLQRINELLHQKLPGLRTKKGTGSIDCGYGLHVSCVEGRVTLTGPISEQYFQVQEVVYGMHQLV